MEAEKATLEDDINDVIVKYVEDNAPVQVEEIMNTLVHLVYGATVQFAEQSEGLFTGEKMKDKFTKGLDSMYSRIIVPE